MTHISRHAKRSSSDSPEPIRTTDAQLLPGDHLPPQPALHGTWWQRTGFTVGPSDGDVLAISPVLPGRVILFGPGGVLDSIPRTSAVIVLRPQQAA